LRRGYGLPQAERKEQKKRFDLDIHKAILANNLQEGHAHISGG